MSSVQTLFMIYYVHKKNIIGAETYTIREYKKLWSLRFFSGINQTISQLFTTNFLIPCFALLCSLSFVSSAKIIASASYLMTKFIQRSVGTTLITTYTYASSPEELPFIIWVVHQLHYFLYILSGLLVVIMPFALGRMCDMSYIHLVMLTILFVCLITIEGFYALYDRLLLLKGHVRATTLLSIVTALALWFAFYTLPLNDNRLMIIVIAIRSLSLACLMYLFIRLYARTNRKLITQSIIGIIALLIIVIIILPYVSHGR